ncbi:MAG: LacI family DNA-binding transcriptional regulator [Sphingomonadaceae bacterium]
MQEPRTVSRLAEIAAEAGVSVSTVSRALAGSPMIAAATRIRISEIARQHGFQINQAARNLRLRRTHAIGLVLPLGHERGQHLSDPFFNAMMGFLADAIVARDHDLLLSRIIPTDDGWLDRLIHSGRVDGVMIIGQSDQIAVLDRAAQHYRPLVVWGAHDVAHRHCTVGSDNRAGGQLAAEHLIAGGCRRLAFLGNPLAPELGQRWAGVEAACAMAGLDAPRLLPVHLTIDEAYAMIAECLRGPNIPDGIVAASDVVAMAAIRALGERGLHVPDDLSVIGYDDVALAAHTAPPLTTVRQPIEEGAALMVDLLFRRLAGEDAASVVLPPTLVVRGTTRRPVSGRS